jgi:hypothetical protein
MTPPPQAPYEQRTSRLAIASFVLGLIFCIPYITPTLGLVFGFIAFIAIGRSEGRLRGRGLAIAGLVISVFVLLGHVWMTQRVVAFAALPGELVNAFLRDVRQGDFAMARTRLASDLAAEITDEELAALKRRLAQEHGEFQEASVDWGGRAFAQGIPRPASGGGAWSAFRSGRDEAGVVQEYSQIPIKCRFSDKPVYGVMLMAVEEDPNVALPLFIQSFTLIGDEGPWTFPFGEEESAAPAEG